jgi:hypothetical protein
MHKITDMKTIEVSDEMYQQLIELATEMTTQDPLGTRMPHLFQIQTDERVYKDDMNGDTKVFVDSSGDFLIIETFEGLKDYMLDKMHESLLPEDLKQWWDDWQEGSIFSTDLVDYLEEQFPELRETSYSIEHKYENAFFTSKACARHIELNDYHYANPKVYLKHAWRNPEMELVSTFLCGLVGKKMHT